MNEHPKESLRSPQRPRKERKQAVLTVIRKEAISDHLVRVVLGGEGFSDLNQNDFSDAYVKLLLPQPGSGLEPPYDMEALRESSPELLPSRRTYTVRRWDLDKGEIWLDFLIHMEPGATGIASDWAHAVEPGAKVAAMGAGGGYAPRADSAFHLLIGDHATVPAILASIEAMGEDAQARALIQLDERGDVLTLDGLPKGVTVSWIIGSRAALLDEVARLDLSPWQDAEGGIQVFCHAERGLTKDLRHHLVVERSIPRENISISAYWALGRIEDQFQAEKREAIGKIDPE